MSSCDTICPEHIECSSVEPAKAMLESCGLRIVDVTMNAINGASFAATAWKTTSARSALHFKENIVAREAEYLAGGGKMILPLTETAIVGG